MASRRDFPRVGKISRQDWARSVSAWLEASCPSSRDIRRFARAESHRPKRWWQEALNRIGHDRKVAADLQRSLQNRLGVGLGDLEGEELDHLNRWIWALDAALQELPHLVQ